VVCGAARRAVGGAFEPAVSRDPDQASATAERSGELSQDGGRAGDERDQEPVEGVEGCRSERRGEGRDRWDESLDAHNNEAGREQQAIATEPVDGLRNAPVPIGAHALTDNQGRIRQPRRVSEAATVGEHDREGADGGEATGERNPAKDPVREERRVRCSRWPAHQLGFGRFALKGDRRREVDEQFHPQDLQWQEDLASRATHASIDS
jgi:hypothetical protein